MYRYTPPRCHLGCPQCFCPCRWGGLTELVWTGLAVTKYILVINYRYLSNMYMLHTCEMRCRSVAIWIGLAITIYILFLYIQSVRCRLVQRRSDCTVLRLQYGPSFCKRRRIFEFCLPILPSRRCNTLRCTVRCQAGTASVISASERPLRPNTSHFHLQHTPLM